jgi:hypothetical protein
MPTFAELDLEIVNNAALYAHFVLVVFVLAAHQCQRLEHRVDLHTLAVLDGLAVEELLLLVQEEEERV